MNLPPIVNDWLAAAQAGTLLTPKHGPTSTGMVYPKFRSITTQDASGIYNFLLSGDYALTRFRNNDPNHTEDYYVITPNDPGFVPGSGVPANVQNPTHPLDRLVVVSGLNSSWHIFAESELRIQNRVGNGTLTPNSV